MAASFMPSRGATREIGMLLRTAVDMAAALAELHGALSPKKEIPLFHPRIPSIPRISSTWSE
jgi:hypothetical protein